MSPEVSTILGVSLVALISLVGLFTAFLAESRLKRFTSLLVSLAAGTFLGDVFFHILPELSHEVDMEIIAFGTIGGILFFFVIEQFLHWHHQHNEEEDNRSLGINNLLGDGLHNFIDGMIVAAAFMVDIPLGVATLIAVAAHEIPQEIGDFGVLLHAGYTKQKALLYNALAASLVIVGASVGLIIGESVEGISHALLAFAAGSFLYIAIADLLPALHHDVNLKRSTIQLIAVLIGLFAMYAITAVEPEHGDEAGEVHDDEVSIIESN